MKETKRSPTPQETVAMLERGNRWMNVVGYVRKLESENKDFRAVLDNYGFPKHEDGDLAYIHGFEARKVLKKHEVRDDRN